MSDASSVDPFLPSSRRHFIKSSAGLAIAAGLGTGKGYGQGRPASSLVDTFDRPDSLYHGEGWESLNPGYWKIEGRRLRRRLKNVGDKARSTGFPYHYESHNRNGGVMDTDYDPSLPGGVLWRRDWKMKGLWKVTLKGRFIAHAKRVGKSLKKMHQPGYGEVGIAFGGQSLFEGYDRLRNGGLFCWSDEGGVALRMNGRTGQRKRREAGGLRPGDTFELTLETVLSGQDKATIRAAFKNDDGEVVDVEMEENRVRTQGFVGIFGKGLIDFEIAEFHVEADERSFLEVKASDCLTCYPLGDTLRKERGKWSVRFVSLFASDGREAEIRIADRSDVDWKKVPVAGRGKVISHEWRRNTAVIDALIPGDPSEKTFFYTIWKDGKNVTADPRIGSSGSGPGTGFVGDVPSSGNYVGRLPRLQAPYRLCGLSCHAINSGLQVRDEKGFRILGGSTDWQIRDQPTQGAYEYFEDYDFQILVWEDDVWYMELVLYPPSTDDAFKVITNTICGPTSRWQMMRHWNVINPGDHDYGMDDIKGPEQLILRNKEGLGQDPAYLKRNFQIVHHLITGEEKVDGTINPKKWRSWKMPNRDFTLAVVDSRLWRSSQDTDIWVRQGWGEQRSLYDRTDPTRTLLGEEQFAWLQELIRTDSSRQICLTGLNGLHAVWTGAKWKGADNPFQNEMNFHQRDRVTADYAGWVKAGRDRVLELLGERDGVVTVYGDVHNGCIMKNKEHRVIECSFGPIGRSGGRSVIPGFGPSMKDVDGRALSVHALYHKTHASPTLEEHAKGEPFYWNFLEMVFNPAEKDCGIYLRIRNMIDAPSVQARGGGELNTANSETGRVPSSGLPVLTTIPDADVRLVDLESGRPLRGTRSLSDGTIPVAGLVDVMKGTRILVTANDGVKAESRIVRTI